MQGKGKILEVLRGVNVPLILQRMQSHLENEVKVKSGEVERVEVRHASFYFKVIVQPVYWNASLASVVNF